jgi:peroxiredoxin
MQPARRASLPRKRKAVAMLGSDLNFGIPDIDLTWTCGGTVNPSCFAGHQLVVLFLPLEAAEAALEMETYDKLSNEFPDVDSFCLAVARDRFASTSHPAPIALDPADAAWKEFTSLAGLDPERAAGAAFVFTRGGALHRVWPGRGHAGDVLAELRTRA